MKKGKSKMKDVAIIGAGAAGMTAAIYARQASLSVTLIEGYVCGGQMIGAPFVENYPGYGSVSGSELSVKMLEDVERSGIKITYDTVMKISKEENGFLLSGKTEDYRARSAIIANGASRRKLGCLGEGEFFGKGVSYCAVCDGGLYKNKRAAVVGGGNSALEDALWLSGICDEVYLIHRRGEFRADEKLSLLVSEKKNIKKFMFRTVSEIIGDDRVTGARLEDVESGKLETVECDGIFIAIGLKPENKRFEDIVELDHYGYIRAGEDCLTSHSGIFAAGDTRSKSFRQIVTAAADGAAAARGAVEYIRSNC